MKRAYTLILAALAVVACFAAEPPKKTKKPASSTTASAVHKPSATTVSRTPSGHSTAAKHSTTTSVKNVKYVRRHGKLVRVAASSATALSYQLHPDPERYQQIQQALADKGYYKGEVNGQWGDDSVDALRRFQTDQKLDGDGHVTALSLTNLGLGPKHDGDISAPAPATGITPVPNNSVPTNAASPSLTPVSTPAAAPPVKPPEQQTKQ
jgi:hypothetical protein